MDKRWVLIIFLYAAFSSIVFSVMLSSAFGISAFNLLNVIFNFGIIVIVGCSVLSILLISEKFQNYLSHEDFTQVQSYTILTLLALMVATPIVILPIVFGISSTMFANWSNLSDVEKIVIYFQYSHLASIITFVPTVIYLIHKYHNLLSAIIVTIFGIGFAEFTTIPIHLLRWGNILGYFWTWFLPFALMVFPMYVARKHFQFTKRFVIAFLILYPIEFLVFLPFVQWTSIWNYSTHSFGFNPVLVGKPFTFGMWFMEEIGRFRRTKDAILPVFINKKAI